MAEGETNADAQLDAASPGAPELLRATLEKIVFFEWRVRELSAELSSAQARAQAAELERATADEAARAAAAQAQAAQLRAAEVEAERSRLAALVSRPAQLAGPGGDAAELAMLRERSARLAEALEAARLQIARQKDERARWLNEMIAQARSGDEAPAALAQFISELRGEVIALRQRQQETDALLAQAGIEPPKAAGAPPLPAAEPMARTRGAVEAARALWDEGRLGGLNAALEQAAAAAAALERPAPGQPGPSGATRALAEQCLRGLAAADPARRAQAARHLAALPVKAAAPALAAALAREEQPQAKAALARALVACGEEAAQRIVQGLLDPREPPLVRLAALEALSSSSGEAGLAALEAAARDPEPALRRRAAALALERGGCEPLVARLSADREATVRAAARGVEASPTLAPAQELAPAIRASAPSARRPETAAGDRSASPEGPRGPAAAPAGAIAPQPAPLPAPGGPEAEVSPAASAVPADARREALHAVRAALFGLTEAELGEAVGLQGDDATRFARALVEEGFLSRRGRKLVAGEAAPQQEQGGAAR